MASRWYHERVPSDEELLDALAANLSNAADDGITTTPDRRKLFHQELTPQFSPEEENRNDDARPEDFDEESHLRSDEDFARRLMEEEAVAVYTHHLEAMQGDPMRLVRNNIDQADVHAMLNAMEMDEHGNISGVEHGADYDQLLQLGEGIGDVKAERWAIVAEQEIEKIPIFTFVHDVDAKGREESESDHSHDTERKCLVCQYDYENEELLRRLPCGHSFHSNCVVQWLKTTDNCPYCRQSIVHSDDSIP